MADWKQAVPDIESNKPLSEADPEIDALIKAEKERQCSGLEFIASENFTSRAVIEALGSCLTNKYAEGLPGHRYYGGNEVIDQVESLCQKRCLAAFSLDPAVWGVNVQPYSGSSANFEVFTALLRPHDRIMGLDLPSGGHLTHGYQTDKKKISATSIFFESMPYQIDETGYVDFAALEKSASLFRPQLVIVGASAYARDWNYKEFRRIADKHSAYLMSDMAHISGLVAAGEAASPFEWCDVVTTTTHKTLRGPRAGLIFFRRQPRAGVTPAVAAATSDLEKRINDTVFPGCQGGPHENTIAAIAVAMRETMDPSFKVYAAQVRANSKRTGEELVKRGYKLVTGGTDNHLVLWDLRPTGLTGSKVEKVFDLIHISVNKNAVFGDTSALQPGGVRLGSPSLTTRGMKEEDFAAAVELMHRAIIISLKIQEEVGKKLTDFIPAIEKSAELAAVRDDVLALARRFPMPGHPKCAW